MGVVLISCNKNNTLIEKVLRLIKSFKYKGFYFNVSNTHDVIQVCLRKKNFLKFFVNLFWNVWLTLTQIIQRSEGQTFKDLNDAFMLKESNSSLLLRYCVKRVVRVSAIYRLIILEQTVDGLLKFLYRHFFIMPPKNL